MKPYMGSLKIFSLFITFTIWLFFLLRSRLLKSIYPIKYEEYFWLCLHQSLSQNWTNSPLCQFKTFAWILSGVNWTWIELNLKSDKATIDVSKSAQVKALIASTDLIFDMYQKSNATIEGDVTNLKLRLDNNSDFVGSKLTAVNAQIFAEGYANGKINIKTNVAIDIAGKSEIQLYGEPKIEIKRFADSATLMKKPTK